MISTRLNFSLITLLLLAVCPLYAQSSDQNFPSPVTESEVEATIRARDVGDARLTTHYWVFDGSQGDIFINVSTQNFSGDIDVYQASDLKPLTKMVMYADSGLSETGRVVYMRQPGRLMLRVQGRTPNDDSASYKIKFAGSFVALAPQKVDGPPTVDTTENTRVKVNSVGTIVAVTPKKKPVSSSSDIRSEAASSPPAKRADNEEQPELPKQMPARPTRQTSVGINTVRGNRSTTNNSGSSTAAPPAQTPSNGSADRSRRTRASDLVAGYMLVVVFKDGSNLQVSMADVVRFGYEDGKLWIYGKNRTLSSYAVGLIESVTMK